jgi:hypothetical protein
MINYREQAHLTLRKDTIKEIINNKRYANLATQNKTSNLLISLSQLNITQDKVAYYNNLDQVKYI